MGMFDAPTTGQIAAALNDHLDDATAVDAYVIGQGHGGRVAIVATASHVYVVKIGMFKLKGKRQLAKYPLGSVRIERRALWLTAGDETVKLGMADSKRAARLEQVVNGR